MKSIFEEKPCDTCNLDRQVGNPDRWKCECDRCTKIGQWRNEVIIRCSKIEKVLGKEYDLEELYKIVKANKDGRTIISPCKIGDKVKVDVKSWGDVWDYVTVDNGKFLIGEIVSIIKTKNQTLIKIKVEHNAEWKRPMKRYPISSIGKTVFIIK